MSDDRTDDRVFPAAPGPEQPDDAVRQALDRAHQLGDEGDYAGLLAFMDEGHFITVGIEQGENARDIVVRLRKDPGDGERGEIVHSSPWSDAGAQLRLTFNGGSAVAAWREGDDREWTQSPPVNVEPLSSIHAGLFTGLVVGPYAVAGR